MIDEFPDHPHQVSFLRAFCPMIGQIGSSFSFKATNRRNIEIKNTLAISGQKLISPVSQNANIPVTFLISKAIKGGRGI